MRFEARTFREERNRASPIPLLRTSEPNLEYPDAFEHFVRGLLSQCRRLEEFKQVRTALHDEGHVECHLKSVVGVDMIVVHAVHNSDIMPHAILLVDDNDLYRGMLRSLLELHGYLVIPARNGAEGLACAATQRVDAALVDVSMPEMDGFELCRRLKAQQQAAGQDVPVWIITGTIRPALARSAAAAGTLLVLRKPFPIEELCGQLERELQKRESPPTSN